MSDVARGLRAAVFIFANRAAVLWRKGAGHVKVAILVKRKRAADLAMSAVEFETRAVIGNLKRSMLAAPRADCIALDTFITSKVGGMECAEGCDNKSKPHNGLLFHSRLC